MAKLKKKNGEKYCSQCGFWFQSLANHWTQSNSCKYPNLPAELHDVVFGLLITQGSFRTRKGGRQNRFAVAKKDEDKLKTLSSIFGVYANSITKSEIEISNKFFETNNKTTTAMMLNFMPFGDVQCKNDINISNSELVMKTVFFMSGKLRSPNDVDELNLRLSDDCYQLLNQVNAPEPTSNIKIDNRGSNWRQLRYERSVYDKYASVSWPNGWWRQK